LRLRIVSEENILVSLTASREKGEIVYRVECASDLTKEEFEYYLSEIVKGVCEWNKTICEESIKRFKGTIKKRR
jgi:hypothetical protein